MYVLGLTLFVSPVFLIIVCRSIHYLVVKKSGEPYKVTLLLK
jgi:hypothetical protein